jgi:hypothetical protein
MLCRDFANRTFVVGVYLIHGSMGEFVCLSCLGFTYRIFTLVLSI